MRFLRLIVPVVSVLFHPKQELLAPTFRPIRIVYEVPTIEDVSRSISRFENCSRLLNAGCLRYAKWEHNAVRNSHGYARYGLASDGDSDLRRLVRRRMERYSSLYLALKPWESRDSVIQDLERQGFVVGQAW